MGHNQVVIENINNVVVVEDNGIGQRRLVVVVEEPRKEVHIEETGIRIVQMGVQGPPGTGITQNLLTKLNTYVHNQAIPSNEWVITHNLETFPSVTLVNSAGEQMIMEVEYVDFNTVICRSAAPIGGKAYLN